MRMRKAFQVAMVLGAWIVWQSGIATAQEVAAPPPMQVLGPLYAYGPAPVPFEPRRYQRPRSQSRNGYSNYRPRAPYGAYYGYRFAPGPGYAPRYQGRYARPDWYGRPGYAADGYRPRYAARFVTPRWYGGPQQALATAYRQRW